jgi:hypothetical protein
MELVSSQEFLAQPLRVHSFLAGVPLHDVWAVNLPPVREGITLQEFLRFINKTDTRQNISWPARGLFGLRILLGRILGWDEQPEGTTQVSFADRLTEEDQARSSVPAGTAEGFFRVVYSFENEVLREAVNRTVHAATLLALFRKRTEYRLYFAVYVQKVSWITPVYMTLIGPFRAWVVYPAIFRQIQRSWIEAFGRGEAPIG